MMTLLNLALAIVAVLINDYVAGFWLGFLV